MQQQQKKLSDYDTSKQFEAKVISNERITPEEAEAEVRHIVLEVNDNAFEYHPGQNIGVLVPTDGEFGNKEHFRLYSIASSEGGEGDRKQFAIAVRRCFYIDDFSGERMKGVASNYLCDRSPGDTIRITGPYGGAFELPKDENINLLMIGMGTGIAPFRAFVKQIYAEKGGWKGKVRLFFGAKRGLELIYMNDVKNDFALYYDKDTFQAFEALSPRPALDEPVALDEAIEQHGKEVWEMVQDPLTNVYVAGQEGVMERLDKAMGKLAGSEEVWQRKKQDLKDKGRWFELIY